MEGQISSLVNRQHLPIRPLVHCAGIAILLSASLVGRASSQAALQDRGTIRTVMQAAVDSGFTGVVLIAQGDSLIWTEAYPSPGGPLTTGSAFWIASITKSFTAAAVATLVDRHRLSLADTLARFFPNVPLDKAAITLRQLLTHTAGFGASYSGGGIYDRATAVRAILQQPLAYPSGAGYRYGDDDYELLAAIVEVVSRTSWETFLQRTLLTPARLRATGFWCQRQPGVPRPVAGTEGRLPVCRRADYGHQGANGMSSTAADLWTWARLLHRPEGLSPSVREALTSPQVLVRQEGTTDVSVGFGTRVYSQAGTVTEVRLSGSGDNGHTSLVRLFPSGLTIIVLSNAGHHAGATWASYVGEQLARRP